MFLRNVNPVGDIELPLLGRYLARDEVFEIEDDLGSALLEQIGNYEPADPPTPDATPAPVDPTTAQEG